MGVGLVLDVFEWDVKMYFLFNVVLYDVVVVVWACKWEYDYVCLISSIWYMGI